MFKRFRVLVLFFALLLLPLGLFLHINHNTAALAEQDEIPISIETRPMRLGQRNECGSAALFDHAESAGDGAAADLDSG